MSILINHMRTMTKSRIESRNQSRKQMWDERYAARELVWSAGPNTMFATEIADLQPGKALDVACGEGRNGLWLAEHGWSVTMIDFSSVAIDKTKQIAEQRGVDVLALADDVSVYPLPEAEFDLVAVLYLHTPPQERHRWLRNVVRSVKPDGTFLYIGHDPSNIEKGVGGPQDIQLLPDVAELTGALEGFRIDVAEVRGRPVVDDPGHRSAATGIALDTFIRAVREKP